MTLRSHICPVALLGIALAFLSIGTYAVAQELQPPFMAPTQPSLCYGRFYLQAGAKYRNVDAFRFDVLAGPNSITANPGTVPFGPTVAGNFGVGTGQPGFDGTSGTPTANGSFSWVYDNGQISGDVIPGGTLIAPSPATALTPALPNTCTSGTPPVTVFCNSDSLWTYSVVDPVIGRFVTTVSGGCCTGQASVSLGSFVIDDPTTQVNNLTNMSQTTQVTFSVAEPESLVFSLDPTSDINRVFEAPVWGPSIEAGFQWSNYFDLFSGFFWFRTNNSMALSDTIQGQAGNIIIQDTFPFVSDDTAAWPVALGAFQSSDSINTGSSQFHNYHIATNSPLLGIFPNRQFITQTNAVLPVEIIHENITNSAEMNVIENRYGGRSWFPLYGMGRIGVTMGAAVIPVHYNISAARTYVASGSSGTVAPGTVLFTETATYDDWLPHYGLFVGGDLSIGGTGYYLNGSVDYTWANAQNYELIGIRTSFNPGGFTTGISGGIMF